MATKASKPKKSTDCAWMLTPEYTAYRRGQVRASEVRAAHGGRLSRKLKAALYAEVEAEITEIKRLRARGLPLPAKSRAH